MVDDEMKVVTRHGALKTRASRRRTGAEAPRCDQESLERQIHGRALPRVKTAFSFYTS